jgi:hypothetical protein
MKVFERGDGVIAIGAAAQLYARFEEGKQEGTDEMAYIGNV